MREAPDATAQGQERTGKIGCKPETDGCSQLYSQRHKHLFWSDPDSLTRIRVEGEKASVLDFCMSS